MEKLIKKIGNEFPVALVNFRGFHSTVFTFDHFVIRNNGLIVTPFPWISFMAIRV